MNSSDTVREIISNHEKDYGKFVGLADIAQELKDVVNFRGISLSTTQKESLEMIMVKIARILNGNPNYVDNWIDIAGYAQLIIDDLKGQQNGVVTPFTRASISDTFHTRPLCNGDCAYLIDNQIDPTL